MNSESPPPPLPIEVWGQIFENIDDPLDLMRAQKVCRRWNEEINRVLPFADWKKLCLNEIGAFALSSIIAVIKPTLSKINYRDLEDQDLWRNVYNHYTKLLKIKELSVKIFRPKTDLLLFIDEFITCVDIWDSWVIYGTNYDKVNIFRDFEYKKSFRALNCHDKILEVKFWYSDYNNFWFLVLTQSYFIKIWNVIDDKKTTYVMPGHRLCVGTANNLYYIYNNFVMKPRFTPENITIQSIQRLSLISGERVVAMSSRESKVFIVVQVETQLRIFTLNDESMTNEERMFQIQSIIKVPSLPVIPSNLHVYVTLNRTIICTQNGQMCLHIPKTGYWVTHQQSPYFDANITSLIVHGNYLIIGLSNGILCIYHVTGIGDLLSSRLFQRTPVKMYSLGILPITAIKIADFSGEIHIAAFNRKNMFCLIL